MPSGTVPAAGAQASERHGEQTGLITRPIPRSTSGERVPAIGLGTFMTFDRLPRAPRAQLRSVLDTFWRGGGRVVDTSALYGASEANVGEFARQLGITSRMFLTDKSWNCGEYAFDPSHTKRQFAQSLQRLSRKQLDVVGIHSMTNVGMVLPVLRALKEEGKIRYVGLTSHEMYQYGGMEPAMIAGLIEFVQVRYSIFQRTAEERLLPLAADHGIAVMVNMALEKARLHKIVEGKALPGFAREFGIRNWTEYFLKYVVGHPAVTCVVPATTNPEHAKENLGAMRGPLPDTAMRRQMLEYLQGMDGFDRLASMRLVPGEDLRRRSGQAPRAAPDRLTLVSMRGLAGPMGGAVGGRRRTEGSAEQRREVALAGQADLVGHLGDRRTLDRAEQAGCAVEASLRDVGVRADAGGGLEPPAEAVAVHPGEVGQHHQAQVVGEVLLDVLGHPPDRGGSQRVRSGDATRGEA